MSEQSPATPSQPSNGDSGMSKIASAFIAGTLFGVFSAVGIAPGGGGLGDGVAPAAGGGAVLGEGGGTMLGDGGGLGDPSVDGGLGTSDGGFGDGGLGSDSGGLSLGDSGAAGGSSSLGGTSGGGSTGGSSSGSTTGGSSSGTSGGRSGAGVSLGGGSEGGGGAGVSGARSTGGAGGGGAQGATGGAGGSGCGANNGGATDVGVSANEIKVASTVVLDGPGASLLEPAGVGMQAVIDQANRDGGICGRRITLETRNDSWDSAKGRDYIRRFIEAKNFSLLVVPSSEGLAAAIQAGDISRAGIPVIGTTGLRIDEYKDQWVFPVSTSTISIMRIMASYAATKGGASTFGIVWDSKYKFGLEGASAFKQYIGEINGASLKADQPLDPDKPSYGTEAAKFNGDCGNSGSNSGCDATMLLLVPETALKWRSSNTGATAGRGKTVYGAQTLFTDDFATKCKDWCDGMKVWTGYNPPIPPVDSKTGVRTYVSAVRSARPSIDYRNQFVEGAYLGAQVFVEAVKACSPNLTRACIRDTLNQAQFQTDLASTLSWSPQSHFANLTAQSFSMEASGGSFNGWRYDNTGFIRDPKPGA